MASLGEAVEAMGRYQREHPLSSDEVDPIVKSLEPQTGELKGKPL
jgi:cytochrome c peroxidase